MNFKVPELEPGNGEFGIRGPYQEKCGGEEDEHGGATNVSTGRSPKKLSRGTVVLR